MNRLEQLMSQYPEINFQFTNKLPDKLGALTWNNNVYINKNRSYMQNLADVTEEIGHYKTTVGNIVEQKSQLDRNQELQARKVGYMILVTLDGLIDCYEKDITTPWDIAEYYDCNVDYLWRALSTYKSKYGERFIYNNYQFDLSNGLNIYKIKEPSKNDH